MKRIWLLALTVVLVVSFTSLALAKKKKKTTQKSGIVVTDAVVIKTTVEDIDYPNRSVTFKGPKGAAVTLKVDTSVKDLDQVKKGDKVVAKYLESIAVNVEKASGKATADGTSAVEVASRGKRSARIAAKVSEVQASIESVNYRKHTLTLESPGGKTLTFKADKRVKNLRDVKAGDEVVVRHTEALIISLEK